MGTSFLGCSVRKKSECDQGKNGRCWQVVWIGGCQPRILENVSRIEWGKVVSVCLCTILITVVHASAGEAEKQVSNENWMLKANIQCIRTMHWRVGNRNKIDAQTQELAVRAHYNGPQSKICKPWNKWKTSASLENFGIFQTPIEPVPVTITVVIVIAIVIVDVVAISQSESGRIFNHHG